MIEGFERIKLIKKINKKINRKIAKLNNEILGSKIGHGPISIQHFWKLKNYWPLKAFIIVTYKYPKPVSK